MEEFKHPFLDTLREFELTFEHKYGRKMTDDERRFFEATRKIIEQGLVVKHLRKATGKN